MKEWIVEEVPALTLDGKVASTMFRKEQELVRCKDCAKKDDPYICKLDGYIQEFGGHRTEEYDDWFCADAERRDDHGPDDQHG